MNDPLAPLMEHASLDIVMFDVHSRTEMNYRDRIFETTYCMSYNKEGTANLRIGDQLYLIKPGSVMFMPPGVIHDQYKDSSETSVFLWWIFSFRIAGAIDVLDLFDIPYVYPLRNRERFEKVFEDYFMASSPSTEGWAKVLLRRAKSLELLYYLLEDAMAYGNAGRFGSKSLPFIELANRILQHPEQDIRLEEAARDLHFNPTHLSNRFKALFGIAPVQLQKRLKIERAKQLLLSSGSLPISEIARHMGFDEPQNFTRLFKNHTGMSPLQYRKLHS
ncbi:MAG: helix-turn-helix transcriptional regulator [Gorillibacterium sp.]|nr:helix-turn-helix transcriptional regulator [Gorillibacterium sp.]